MNKPLEKKDGKIFIVSGPSGAGKSTLCKKVVDFFHDLMFSVSYTTRKPRPGEKDGIEYRFIDNEKFEEMVKKDEFAEYAAVHGKKYGTSWKDLNGTLSRGIDTILDIDVQGAEKLRKKFERGVYIFVLPPSIGACLERLGKRGDTGPQDMEKRLNTAREEIKTAPSYEYIIINDDLEGAFGKLKSIIIAERSKKEEMLGTLSRLFNI